MEKPRILLIGASSLIGSHVYRGLLDKDYPLVGTYFLCKYKGLARLDIADSKQLASFIEASDIVINCAALAGRENCNRNPERAREINVDGCFNIAYQCHIKRKKMIHFSSVSVLDEHKPNPHQESERPCSRFGDWYNLTKGISENIVESLLNNYIVIRMTYAYGTKADDSKKIGGDLFRFVYETLRDDREVIAYNKTPTNPTYLPDIRKALTSLIDLSYEGRINLGGEQTEVCTFFEEIKRVFKLPGKILLGSSSINRALDLSKMHELGIQMSTLKEGLERLLEEAPYLRS